MPIPAKNKYRNQPTVHDGIRFASKAEAARYQQLKILERAGEVSSLTMQQRYPLMVNGTKVAHYVSDFDYFDVRRGRVIEDVKGIQTPAFRLKRKMFEAQYGIEITIIGSGR